MKLLREKKKSGFVINREREDILRNGPANKLRPNYGHVSGTFQLFALLIDHIKGMWSAVRFDGADS